MNTARQVCALIALCLLALAAGCGDDAASPTSSPVSSTSPATSTSVAALPIPHPTELYVVAADGSGEKLLYSTDLFPNYAWSPDGRTLAVAESDNATTIVRFIDLDGNELASLPHNGVAAPLTWSPDGRFVVTTASKATATFVLAIATDGSEQNEVLSVPSPDSPTLSNWLPSGELLVIMSDAAGNGRLSAIDITEGSTRDVTGATIHSGFFGQPSVSPDGLSIAAAVAEPAPFDCFVAPSKVAVSIIDLSSGVERRVTEPRCGIEQIVWSPDGQQLAFSNIARDSAGLYVYDLASGTERRLSTGLDRPVEWRDDRTIIGKRYHCTGCDAGPPIIWRIDADTGEYTELVPGLLSALSPTADVVAEADAGVITVGFDGQQVDRLVSPDETWQFQALDWSPDGSHIFYIRSHRQGAWVFEVNTDGSDFEKLVFRPNEFKLSPDGTRIAYRNFDNVTGQYSGLLVANADGSGETIVFDGGASFEWSPDSQRLLLGVSDPSGSSAQPGMYVVGADGTGLRQLGDTPPISYHPIAWSPDGEYAVFTSALSLDVVDINTGEITTVGEVNEYATHVTWSSDGRRLAYDRSGGAYVVGRDGTQIFSIPTVSPNYQTKAAISPDGTSIAVLGFDLANKVHQVIVVDVATGDRSVVLEGTLSSSTDLPVWSPDGRSLAMPIATTSGYGIYIAQADGSGVRRVTRGANVASITWLGTDRLRFTSFIGGL